MQTYRKLLYYSMFRNHRQKPIQRKGTNKSRREKSVHGDNAEQGLSLNPKEIKKEGDKNAHGPC